MSPECPSHGGKDHVLLTRDDTTNEFRCHVMDHLFYEDRKTGKTRLAR